MAENSSRSSFGMDVIVLNGTDSSSTDAGEALIFDNTAITFTLLLNGTDNVQSNAGNNIILDGTDSSSTDAGDNILPEDETTAGDFDSLIVSAFSQTDFN